MYPVASPKQPTYGYAALDGRVLIPAHLFFVTPFRARHAVVGVAGGQALIQADGSPVLTASEIKWNGRVGVCTHAGIAAKAIRQDPAGRIVEQPLVELLGPANFVITESTIAFVRDDMIVVRTKDDESASHCLLATPEGFRHVQVNAAVYHHRLPGDLVCVLDPRDPNIFRAWDLQRGQIANERFCDVCPGGDGLMIARMDNTREYFYVDQSFNVVLGGYRDAEPFNEGVAAVLDHGGPRQSYKWYFIDRRGNRLYKTNYETLLPEGRNGFSIAYKRTSLLANSLILNHEFAEVTRKFVSVVFEDGDHPYYECTTGTLAAKHLAIVGQELIQTPYKGPPLDWTHDD